MTIHWSKWKPEIEFQYGGRPFSKTGSSYISALDWDILSKFVKQIDFHLRKQIPSLKLNRKYISDSMAAILKIRYDVITTPSNVRFLRNLEDRCKMTQMVLWRVTTSTETTNLQQVRCNHHVMNVRGRRLANDTKHHDSVSGQSRRARQIVGWSRNPVVETARRVSVTIT